MHMRGTMAENLGKLKSKAWALVCEESGQTTTEYVLLLAVVVFIVMRVKGVMQTNLNSLVENAFNKANQELRND